MILRRFMKHVSDQNWIAVGLDVLVVITGIFLGMQVTDWNEVRKEQKVEQSFLIRLHDDALTNRTELNEMTSYYQRDVDAIFELIDAIEAATLEGFDGEQVEQGVYSLIALPGIRLRTGTVEELLSAGRMDILRDEGLKILLQEQLALHEFVQTQHRDFRLLIVDKQEQYDRHVLYRSDRNQIKSRMEFDIKALASSTEFQNIVHNALLLKRLLLDYRTNQWELNEYLIERLACNLEQDDCGPLENNYKRGVLL